MSTDIVGKVFESYQITALAGKGGMGAVYKARDLRLDRDVAIKVMDPHLAGDEAFMKRFRIEAKALAHLNNPHIVKIHTLEESKLGVCIVMEYVEGKTLADLIKNTGSLDPSRATNLFAQVLSAFEHAHKAGVVHRDVKPGNIMVTGDDEAKVTDFGLAKVTQPSGATVTQLAGGTLYYMPPEQVEGLTKVDHRGDLYSIGMTLYEAITGAVPFDDAASDYAIRKTIVEGKIRPPREINPRIPKKLNDFVIKSIARDPSRRFQTAGEMKAALLALEVDRQAPPRAASRVKVVALGAAIVVFTAGAYFLSREIFREHGHLSITSFPPGARVVLDNKNIGTTPLQAYSISPGSAALHVEGPGYIPVDTQIVVQSGEATSLALQLRPLIVNAQATISDTRKSVAPREEPVVNGTTQQLPPAVDLAAQKGKAEQPKVEPPSRRHQVEKAGRSDHPPSTPVQPQVQVASTGADRSELERAEAERKTNESAEAARREKEATVTAAAARIAQGIQGLTEQYRKGLENKDVSGLSSLLQWSGREQDAWSKFFELSQDVKVSIEQLTHQPVQNSEQVSFQAKISYFNSTKGKEETKLLPNTWQCENVNGSWKIIVRK